MGQILWTKEDFAVMSFPSEALANHALIFSFPKCSSDIVFACWKREFPQTPLVLKTRTVTSDSLDHLNPTIEDYRDDPKSVDWHPLFIHESEHMWNILKHNFSISRHEAWKTSLYLLENVNEIVVENGASRWYVQTSVLLLLALCENISN